MGATPDKGDNPREPSRPDFVCLGRFHSDSEPTSAIRERPGWGVFALGDDAFSLGFQVWGMAGKTQLTDSSSTGLDLGLTLRPAWWMALSSTLKNANGPHVDGNAQGAVGTIDLGIRPYWERLTLGAGLVVPVDESDRWHPRFQLTTRLLNGFHFGGSLTRGDSVDASGERADEWTTGFHLGVDFSDTMSVFGGWSTPPGEATQVQTAIRFSGEEHAPLLSRTGTWAKVNLAHSLGAARWTILWSEPEELRRYA